MDTWAPEQLKKKYKVMTEMSKRITETLSTMHETLEEATDTKNKMAIFSGLQLNLLCSFMSYQLTKDSEEFDELVTKVLTEEEAEKFFKELEEENND